MLLHMKRSSSTDSGDAPLRRATDRFGAAASFLCALHCAALPFVMALLPALGLGFLASHAFERGFVAFAIVLASVSLAAGFRRHRHPGALRILVPGIALLLAGILLDADARPILHALLVSIGGLLVALAHVANLRFSRCDARDEACGPRCTHATGSR